MSICPPWVQLMTPICRYSLALVPGLLSYQAPPYYEDSQKIFMYLETFVSWFLFLGVFPFLCLFPFLLCVFPFHGVFPFIGVFPFHVVFLFLVCFPFLTWCSTVVWRKGFIAALAVFSFDFSTGTLLIITHLSLPIASLVNSSINLFPFAQ